MSSSSDRRWQGRSNPWCVYSRLTAALLLIVAANSYEELGAWALVPVGGLLVFIILNPYLFPAPRDDAAWATRSVLGQRLWREAPRRWDRPAVLRILSGITYFMGIVTSIEGMLFEGLMLGLVALALKLGYLDWMAKYYTAHKARGA